MYCNWYHAGSSGVVGQVTYKGGGGVHNLLNWLMSTFLQNKPTNPNYDHVLNIIVLERLHNSSAVCACVCARDTDRYMQCVHVVSTAETCTAVKHDTFLGWTFNATWIVLSADLCPSPGKPFSTSLRTLMRSNRHIIPTWNAGGRMLRGSTLPRQVLWCEVMWSPWARHQCESASCASSSDLVERRLFLFSTTTRATRARAGHLTLQTLYFCVVQRSRCQGGRLWFVLSAVKLAKH